MRSGKTVCLGHQLNHGLLFTLRRSGARPRGKCERTHNLKARQATPRAATSRLGPPLQARIRCQLRHSLPPLNSSCADPRPTHLVRACQDSAPSVHCRATAQPPAAGPVQKRWTAPPSIASESFPSKPLLRAYSDTLVMVACGATRATSMILFCRTNHDVHDRVAEVSGDDLMGLRQSILRECTRQSF